MSKRLERKRRRESRRRQQIITAAVVGVVAVGLIAWGVFSLRAGSGDCAIATGDTGTTASGLQYTIIQAGTGRCARPGDTVAVHYRGTLLDGTEFDNSYDRGQPIQFTLGQGQVIPGWDEGIALLNEGAHAQLTIPADLAYGAPGSPPDIPPSSTLVFDVTLVDINPTVAR